MSLRNKILNIFRGIFKFRPFEKCILPFTIHKKYRIIHHLFVPNHTQYPKGSFRKAKRDGIHFILDISDLMDWYIYFGFFEVDKKRLIDKIKPGYTILDIGANIGQISILSAKKTGNRGKVYAIEPDPLNFKKLQKNISLNTDIQIEAIQTALSNKITKCKMIIIDENNTGQNTIDESDESGNIEVNTLDHLVESLQLSRIDLIKIDTEGFELKILQGGLETLRKFRPILYIEIVNNNLKRNGNTSSELFLFLNTLNYNLKMADDLTAIDLKNNYENEQFDILAEYLNP